MNSAASSKGQWWDCHFHVFDNARYPLAPDCAYVPADAPLATFKSLCVSRGVGRAVLVHPSVYGADHRSYEDALAEHGDWLRGVAVVYADPMVTSDAQIEHWDRLGTRGTRINRLFPSAPGDVERVIERVKPFGWHVQVLIDLVADIGVVKRIVQSGVPVVIDHFGHRNAEALLGSTAFADLLALMREGQAWVKLSGPYRADRGSAPWSSLRPVADALLAANDQRLVWGSDWPHPPNAKHPFPAPDNGSITQTIPDWLANPELLELVMHRNPLALYDAPGKD